MNHCPGCGYLVPDAWHECRKCGAALGAALSVTATVSPAGAAAVATMPRVAERPADAPAATVPTAPTAPTAPTDTLLPNGRSALATEAETQRDPWLTESRERLPDTMLPIGRRLPPLPPRKSGPRIPTSYIAAAACAVFLVGAFVMWPNGHAKVLPPMVLAPLAPEAGIPTSLAAVVRVQIESTRHTAVTAIAAAADTAGAGALTTSLLAAQQPGLQWLDGNQASSGPNQVSAQGGPAGATIAVASKSKVLCAFGRWSPSGAEYVTIKNAASCRATEPPETGWSTEGGGSARDLPDETG